MNVDDQQNKQNTMNDKINIVEKYNTYKGYQGDSGTSGCRIWTGERLSTERGMGRILNIIAMNDNRATRKTINAQMNGHMTSYSSSYAWARANKIISLNTKTHEYSLTRRGRNILNDIRENMKR